jgi:hypothetical protein
MSCIFNSVEPIITCEISGIRYDFFFGQIGVKIKAWTLNLLCSENFIIHKFHFIEFSYQFYTIHLAQLNPTMPSTQYCLTHFTKVFSIIYNRPNVFTTEVATNYLHYTIMTVFNIKTQLKYQINCCKQE